MLSLSLSLGLFTPLKMSIEMHEISNHEMETHEKIHKTSKAY